MTYVNMNDITCLNLEHRNFIRIIKCAAQLPYETNKEYEYKPNGFQSPMIGHVGIRKNFSLLEDTIFCIFDGYIRLIKHLMFINVCSIKQASFNIDTYRILINSEDNWCPDVELNYIWLADPIDIINSYNQDKRLLQQASNILLGTK